VLCRPRSKSRRTIWTAWRYVESRCMHPTTVCLRGRNLDILQLNTALLIKSKDDLEVEKKSLQQEVEQVIAIVGWSCRFDLKFTVFVLSAG